MRAWPFALSLVLLSACDGGGGCNIDSDCADFSLVCIDQACVPPGTVNRDAEPPEMDAGPRRDAGPSDAGASDAGADVVVPACTDVAGGWSISVVTGTCGAAVVGYVTNISTTASCMFTAASADAALMPALDGTFTLDAANALTGTLNAGNTGAMACTGMLNTDGTLSAVCVACTLTLTRVP